MKNKHLKLILKILLLCLGFYIGYKFYFLYKYRVSSKTINNYDEFINLISDTDTINIDVKILENVDYLKFNNMKIKNEWSNTLELIKDNTYSHKYIQYDEDKNIKFSIELSGPEQNIIDTFIKDSKNANDGVYNRYYKQNEVSDLISLLKYLAKNNNNESNIFTNSIKIEWIYTMYALPASIFEHATKIKFIEGSYKGILCEYESNNQITVIINKDSKSYGIQFYGLDYFTEERIKSILETLVIE